MTRKTIILLALLGVSLSIMPVVQVDVNAAPEPSIVPKAWALDFSHTKPQPIAVRTVEGDIKWYWYMTYTVENNSGEDRLFIPDITIATDQGDILTSGQNVPSRTFKVVEQRERNPLLLSPSAIIGKVLQGPDFAKESVAIWPHIPSKDLGEFRIFVAGLSGETATIKHPKTDETVVLRKTLMIRYDLPGNMVHPQGQPLIPHAEQWIMR